MHGLAVSLPKKPIVVENLTHLTYRIRVQPFKLEITSIAGQREMLVSKIKINDAVTDLITTVYGDGLIDNFLGIGLRFASSKKKNDQSEVSDITHAFVLWRHWN